MSAQLSKAFSPRHVQLMALGNCIGVGIFLGVGGAISAAGPAVILAYIFCAWITFNIIRSLGEMAVYDPQTTSIQQISNEYMSPFITFSIGWTYWLYWTIVTISEVTAVSIYMQVWFPEIPQWIFALASLLLMGVINLLSARLLGELEFWFASIKILTLGFFIAFGAWTLFNQPELIGNLWQHGGFLANGWLGLLQSIPMVILAYGGVEMIAATFREAKDTRNTIRTAINGVTAILPFVYIGAVTMIVALFPWNQLSQLGSPFVAVFKQLGIYEAVGILNFIVITAALSSCNGVLFAISRTLFGLAEQHHAPRFFFQTNRYNVPSRALFCSTVLPILGISINYFMPEQAFGILASLVSLFIMSIWVMIMIMHLRFKKIRGNNLEYRLPFAPYSNYITLVTLISIIGVILFQVPQAIPVAIIFLACLCVGYRLKKNHA